MKVKTAPPGRYGDGDGFYLLVRPGNPPTRFWVFRYKVAGHDKGREMGLGRAGGARNAVTLSDARTTAAEVYRKVRAGVDPLADRQAARSAAASAKVHTFRDIASLYIAAHESTWRNAVHRQQWQNTLDTYVHPAFGGRPVATVAVGDVMGVDIADVAETLEAQGVASFEKSWDELIESVTKQIEKSGGEVMPAGAVNPAGGAKGQAPAAGAPRASGN